EYGERREERELADRARELHRDQDTAAVVDVEAVLRLRIRIFAELDEEIGERLVSGELHLPPESYQQVLAPFRQIEDARGEAVRMKRQAHHVHRRLQELRARETDEARDARVGGDEIPMTIDGERGIGLVAFEHEIDRFARRAE